MKVTVSFRDEWLYRAVKVRAAASGRQIRDVIEEALETWLEVQEDAEDVAMSREALAEYEREGGVDAIAFFDRLIAEDRVKYEPLPKG
jgi:hypothetical protein